MIIRIAVQEAGHALICRALGMGRVQELSIEVGGGHILTNNTASKACLDGNNNHIAHSFMPTIAIAAIVIFWI